MKILIVCSGNAENFDFPIHQAFIYDQIEAVCRQDESIGYKTFFIKGKGMSGYFSNFSGLKVAVAEYKPDLIHAHGGHVGLLCAWQRKVKVLVTFHGSDINIFLNRCISVIASVLSAGSVFVSQKLLKKARLHGKHTSVIPCGVDFNVFHPVKKEEARALSGLPEDESYVLFSSSFDTAVKNYPLAKAALTRLPGLKIKEIRGKTRREVNNLLNGAGLLLMTSFSEGSPQIVKEAMACNLPIVSTDVGDVREVTGDTEGCYITTFDPNDIAGKIRLALAFGRRTNGREKIGHLDNRVIGGKMMELYKIVTSDK